MIDRFADHDVAVIDPVEIVALLTDDQQECILNLSEEWQDKGYSKVVADILYATDAVCFPGRFDSIVDCRLRWAAGKETCYQHRLLPLGASVKDLLLKMLDTS